MSVKPYQTLGAFAKTFPPTIRVEEEDFGDIFRCCFEPFFPTVRFFGFRVVYVVSIKHQKIVLGDTFLANNFFYVVHINRSWGFLEMLKMVKFDLLVFDSNPSLAKNSYNVELALK